MPRPDFLTRELAGTSPAMVRFRLRVERIAGTSVSVLITGETGTGKTTAARVLHALSQRSAGRLVKVNCSGIPENLFESEFFGHERGAFTGAVSRRLGLMPQADGGSLFLDEIGDMSLAGQAKLLTALDDGEVRLVGGNSTERVDVRLLSATSRDLESAMAEGTFRPDLFHRIAVIRAHLPPLRERPEDLPLLVRTYLRRLAARHGLPLPGLTPDAWAFLHSRPWPGNIRELAHLLEAALILSGRTDALRRADLEDVVPERRPERRPAPPERSEERTTDLPEQPSAPRLGARTEPLAEPDSLRAPDNESPGGPAAAPDPVACRYSSFGSEDDERDRIRAALDGCNGNRTRAARLLGMSRNTLRDRIRRYFPD
jgi:formate hydrogenlyase transcriptional activator